MTLLRQYHLYHYLNHHLSPLSLSSPPLSPANLTHEHKKLVLGSFEQADLSRLIPLTAQTPTILEVLPIFVLFSATPPHASITLEV